MIIIIEFQPRNTVNIITQVQYDGLYTMHGFHAFPRRKTAIRTLCIIIIRFFLLNLQNIKGYFVCHMTLYDSTYYILNNITLFPLLMDISGYFLGRFSLSDAQ